MDAELEPLVRHALNGRAVLFVGAGFSRDSVNILGQTLDTGGALAARLSSDCGLEEPEPLSDVAELFLAKLGASRLVSLLVERYQVTKAPDFGAVFGEVPWKRVYTTNYDDTVELLYKQARRAMIPVSLADSPRRVSEKATLCVHLNGHVRGLTEQSLLGDFKLTDGSYSQGSLVDSPWLDQLRHDLASAKAAFFVGYSGYDLDIKRVLSAIPFSAKKTVFVVGEGAKESLQFKLGRYGRVLAQDAGWFAAKLHSIAESHDPELKMVPDGDYVKRFRVPAVVKEPTDREVYDLFLRGDVDRDLMWGAAVGGAQEPYSVLRDAAYSCLDRAEQGAKWQVYCGGFGNGKTVFLSQVGALATQFGYDVYWVEAQGAASVEEIEEVAKRDVKTLVLVDGYPSLKPEVQVLVRHSSSAVKAVFTARTFQHDIGYHWLRAIVGAELQEFSVDRLAKTEVKKLSALLDRYGLWRHRSGSSESHKEHTLMNACDSKFSLVLLEVLKSPNMQKRLEHLIGAIQEAGPEVLLATTGALILSVLGFGTTSETLTTLLGDNMLNSARFRSDAGIKEVINFESGQPRARNSVVAQHLLREVIGKKVVVEAMAMMARHADRVSHLGMYREILDELMKFRNIQLVLPRERRMGAVSQYYEQLKNLKKCRTNPNFWLQYAVAVFTLGRHDDSRVKLDTAYSYAAKKREYRTYMLDNHDARLALHLYTTEPAPDRESAIATFRKARSTVNAQAADVEHLHYPYRVAEGYAAFFDTNLPLLTLSDVAEMGRAAQHVLNRIAKLDEERAEHPDIVKCKTALESVLRRAMELGAGDSLRDGESV